MNPEPEGGDGDGWGGVYAKEKEGETVTDTTDGMESSPVVSRRAQGQNSSSDSDGNGSLSSSQSSSLSSSQHSSTSDLVDAVQSSINPAEDGGGVLSVNPRTQRTLVGDDGGEKGIFDQDGKRITTDGGLEFRL